MTEATPLNSTDPESPCDTLTPSEIVAKLDEHIVGQNEAKRAVAIALRNRWRRRQVAAELRPEITPKNILMIGPTGVGKTEIARRLAKLVNAPFIKVEATKFTEVGYVGRDVESIIRDLMDMAIKMTREQALADVEQAATDAAEERILEALLQKESNPLSTEKEEDTEPSQAEYTTTAKKQILDVLLKKETHELAQEEEANIPLQQEEKAALRQQLRKQFREHQLDDETIEINVASLSLGVEIMGPPGMEEMTQQLQSMFQSLSGERKKRRRMKVSKAFKLLREDEANKLVNEDEVKLRALERVEQNGIVFIDELDKVTARSDHTSGSDVSREGVQRDLLPLVEGCTISTRHGMIKTDHILFIASGAFHIAKPSDLMPELQGRLPIRVELKALTDQDFIRILTEPQASLIKQYIALLATERVTLTFKDEAVADLARAAWQVNERTENIGARRLHTVMERLLEVLSFEASNQTQKEVTIDAAYVAKQLQSLIKDEDLSRYIL